MTSGYDRPVIVETVCERLAGGEALATICRDEGLPTTRTWLRWCEEDEAVAAEYSRALQARAEWYAAEHDRIRKTAVDRETAAAARVQLNGLEWQMQRAAPKRYGDRIDLDLGVKLDLTSILDRRRQNVLEANARLEITGPEGDAE
jgi:hypothetical protein